MAFLDIVRQKLDLPLAEKEQVMRELESHYHEIEDELLSAGMSECEASAEAARRIGDPSDIAQRMQTVHCRATWKTAILTALPFLGLTVMGRLAWASRLHTNSLGSVGILIGLLICATFMIGSVRELAADRRPLWLASWLPAGIMMLIRLISMVAGGLVKGNISLQLGGVPFPEMEVGIGIQFLLLGALAAWVYRRSKIWRAATMGAVAIGFVMSLWIPRVISHGLTGTIPIYTQFFVHIFFCAIIVALLSIRLFMTHPYGSKIQASLMLYTFLIPGLPHIGSGPEAATFIFWSVMAHSVVSGLAILLLARASQWQLKQWILSAAITLLGLMVVIASVFVSSAPSFDAQTVGIPAMVTMIYLFWIILVPELIDRYYQRRRPEFAR